MKDLDPLMPKCVRDVIGSDDSFLQNAQPVQSVLEKFQISEAALQVLESTIDTLGDVSSHNGSGFRS